MSEPLARLNYETYQRLAPLFGYGPDTTSWEEVPEADRNLMIAVADVIEMEFFGPAKGDELIPNELFVQTGYGAATKQPFVTLTYNGRKIAQMPPENAVDFAHNVLACAEASLSDAFLVEFMRDRVGLEMAQVGGLLVEFREWRDKREEQQQP
jgi:hypothetical protein